jgi:peptide deformylase
MAIRTIVHLGENVLRHKAQRVRKFDKDLHSLIDDMVETMLEAPGVGLAAPQVGISQRVIVVRLPDDEEAIEEFGDKAGVLYEVVNPEILRPSDEIVEGIEGCLSVPGYVGKVDRHVHITVRGQDRNGKEIRVKAHDWLARVFQHEIDHLDGILYIDRASEVWKPGETSPSVEEQDSQQEVVSSPSPAEEHTS